MKDDITAWFEKGDQPAGERLRDALACVMFPTRRLLRVVSAEELDEIRQEVLAQLMDRSNDHLIKATSPLAYARRCWTNACTNALRKWGPRLERANEVRRFLDTPSPAPDQLAAVTIDADIAIKAMAVLTARQRIALLVITRPAAIGPDDWGRALHQQHPDLPPLPLEPAEREDAAYLLFGHVQSAADRRRRQTSFDKLVRRAIASLRKELGVDK